MLLLFGIIWKSEDQNNEFNNPEQPPPTIRFTWVVNLSVRDRTLKLHGLLSVHTHFVLDLDLWIAIANQSRFPIYGFCVYHFRIKVLRYPPRTLNIRDTRGRSKKLESTMLEEDDEIKE